MDQIVAMLDTMASSVIGRDLVASDEVLDWILDLRNLVAPPVPVEKWTDDDEERVIAALPDVPSDAPPDLSETAARFLAMKEERER